MMQQQFAAQQQQVEQLKQENRRMQQENRQMLAQFLERKVDASPSPGPGSTSAKPVDIQPAKPDTFNGSRRNSPDVWVFGLETFFKATGVVNPEQQINFAAAQLRESAATWWRRLSVMEEEAPKTWAEFKERFLRQFMPVASRETARASLHSMKQRNTVAGYCDAFTSCLLQLEEDDMSQADQLFLFKRGLSEKVALQLNLVRPKTLQEAMATAVLIEQENRNYQRISGGTNAGKGSGYFNRNAGGYSGGKGNGSAPMELGNLNQQDHDQATDHEQTDTDEEQALNAMTGRRDRLTPEQVKDYMKRGVCFTCSKPGHLSRNCPARSRPQAQQGSKK